QRLAESLEIDWLRHGFVDVQVERFSESHRFVANVLLGAADDDDLGPAADRREMTEHVDSEMLAKPEVERNAVELPRTQHLAGVFVGAGGRGGEPDLVGDTADDGAVNERVFDDQQAAWILRGWIRFYVRIHHRLPIRLFLTEH